MINHGICIKTSFSSLLLRRLSAVVCLICVCFGAQGTTERVITLDNSLMATHTPAVGETKGSVLLIHGWAGNMNEVGDMYKRLAAQLAERHIASLRINIRGESERESTGYRLTSTFASRVTDAETGLAFLRQQYSVQPTGVVGFSLGGSTTIRLMGLHPADINSVVLWSSAGDPSLVGQSILSAAQMRQVLETGEVKVPTWETLTVTKEHVLGMMGYDIYQNLSAYKEPLLSIRGSEDYVKPIEKILFPLTSSTLAEARVLQGADHIFDAYNPKSHFDERVIKQTLEWLTDTL
ncbi:alpha/beta fold hydrolase [Paraglaciecola sp. 20A4]|uniref:alpha/beta hydrolase n=1 Tax=Paraglaciecola sp. 20A4 TaxID=2687288 RepID=UPI00140C385D|nr:alpha/beta fold hydrolase [Paraglaciecola sp. 20A4]